MLMFEEEDDDFFEGNLNEDIERFEAYLKGSSLGFFDSERFEGIIDHFLIQGQYSKAKEAAEIAINQYPFTTLFQLRKAQSMSGLGQLKEALTLINQIEKMEEAKGELLLTKASIFSQLKDSKNAIKYYRAALAHLELDERDDIYIDLAMEYELDNDYNSAIKVLREAIAMNPHNEGAIYEMAFCYDQLEEYDRSIDCYSNFIDENPYSYTAWYNLGNAYSKLENYEKAIWAYDYCIIINEDFSPVYFNLANAYLSMDKYNMAIENFTKCIDLEGDDATAYCYIGECYEQLGQLDLAKHHYQKSLELAPMLPDAWLGLGILEDLNGNTQEGIVLIHKALELDPNNAGICCVLGTAYQKLEKNDEALTYYYLALEVEPEDEESLINVIQILSERSLLEAFNYLRENEIGLLLNRSFNLLRVSILYQMGASQQALELFAVCVAENLEKAQELFTINPELLNVQEFVHLADKK